ncbi:MAG: bifunctional (p)ppGpp synthetase/guanosine-3',5'-bis(diphosphate) 3'-pyrophosphohydrolase [Prevotellaceae bacterium]|jgi:GTP pyrophosphokinase|nr:bifunctional (p)ppGpp synthetase/guanosine-3',5'-bis(diphosphate) 3'-pyrophosphohydrolase [Prevotellaceae bacterium]
MKQPDIQDDKGRAIADAAFQDMLNSSLLPISPEEKVAIDKAYTLAYEAHKGARRKSGEPYIIHPIAVAKIVASEIGLGYKSIVTALLHDVVEDTHYTVEDIQTLFGDKIASLVDGLTKLDNIFDANISLQAENFKKLLLAMADDIRVVLIKLADRLHNMRTLSAMAPHKREKIASETLYLYAPLAQRLGLYNIKTELEDLTLQHQYPQVYKEIQSKIAATEEERQAYIKTFCEPIKERLQKGNINFDINGRVKSVYSIWNKMQKQQIPFEEVYDLFAVRIVINTPPGPNEKTQCWFAYSTATDIYRPNPRRMRDWISSPKANGYEALHTTVMGPKGRWVEIQIRSKRMNQVAEYGYAAHWIYKENGNNINGFENVQNTQLDEFLYHIREMLANNEQNTVEFLDQVKLNLFTSEITVFTPKGKIITLPKNATVLDFAYYIHSAIGNRAISAKVNHELKALNHILSNGDQIEIITADNQKPQPEWLQFVTTARAQSHIKAALKSEGKAIFQKGKTAVEEATREAGWYANAKLYKLLADAYHVSNKEELFSKIGSGTLSPNEISRVVKRYLGRSKWLRYWGMQLRPRLPQLRRKSAMKAILELPHSEAIDKKAFLLKEGTDPSTLDYRIAQCCSPIPGDSVVGFIGANNKVTIHKKNCPTAIREAAQHGDKLVNAKWTEHTMMLFLARINVSGADRQGLLTDMLDVISTGMHVNIRRVNIETHGGLFEGEFDLYVHSTKELDNIISKLGKVAGVQSAKRGNNNE